MPKDNEDDMRSQTRDDSNHTEIQYFPQVEDLASVKLIDFKAVFVTTKNSVDQPAALFFIFIFIFLSSIDN